MLPALLLIVGVAVLALFLRAGAGRRDETVPSSPGVADEPDDRPDDASSEDDAVEEGMVEAAAITSDGWAFVPVGTGLTMIPPGHEEEMLADEARSQGSQALSDAIAAAPVNPHTGRRVVFWRPGESLAPGDLIAARVVRGAPGVDPWRLEALGVDYDYRSYAFETEEAAQTALQLVQARIVRPPKDEHGEAVPVGAEDFAVARRKHEETEQALAMDSDDDREE